jgi:PleD family two-component response regulator
MSPDAGERERPGATVAAPGTRDLETAPIRVLVDDDHAIVREGIRALLEVPGMEVVGEAASGADALRIASDLRPDLVSRTCGCRGWTGFRPRRPSGANSPTRQS